MIFGILKKQPTATVTDDDVAAVFAAPLNIISNKPAMVADSMSLRRISSSTGVQRWEIEAAIAQTNNNVSTFITQLRAGYSNTVYVRMPQPVKVNYFSGTLKTNGNHSRGASVITVGSSPTGLQGEFIQFGTLPKVYLVTDMVSSGTSSTITIEPPLITAVAHDTSLKIGGNVVMPSFVDPSIALGIKYSDGILLDLGTIKLVERL